MTGACVMRAGTVILMVAISGSLDADAGRRNAPPPPTPKLESLHVDSETKLWTVQEVVPVEGVSAKDLFSRGRAWVATTYLSANDVVQLTDADAGRLIAKGQTSIPWTMIRLLVWHTVTLEVKEGRYRVTVSDFQLSSETDTWRQSLETERWSNSPKVLERVDSEIAGLLASLRKGMTAPVSESDW